MIKPPFFVSVSLQEGIDLELLQTQPARQTSRLWLEASRGRDSPTIERPFSHVALRFKVER